MDQFKLVEILVATGITIILALVGAIYMGLSSKMEKVDDRLRAHVEEEEMDFVREIGQVKDLISQSDLKTHSALSAIGERLVRLETRMPNGEGKAAVEMLQQVLNRLPEAPKRKARR